MSDDDMSDHDILRTLRALSRQSQDLPQALRGLLGQLGTDLPIFGANPQYRAILEKIKPSNPPQVQMASLTELCELLSMTSEEMLTISGFSTEAYVPVLAAIISEPPSMEVLLQACRALAAVLDIFSNAQTIELAVSNNVVASLCDKMLNIEYMDVAELALRMLERICMADSAETRQAVVQENGVVALLQFVDFFAVDVQRAAARTTMYLCTDVSDASWFQLQMGLPLIQNLARSFDADIVYHGCECLRRLCKSPFVASDLHRIHDIIDSPLADHLLSLLSTYCDDRLPENMKTATFPILIQLMSALSLQDIGIFLNADLTKVLHAVFAAQITSSKSAMLDASIRLVSTVVSASVSSTEKSNLVLPLVEPLLPLMLRMYESITQDVMRNLYLDTMYQVMTFLSTRALAHPEALCKFVSTALWREKPQDQELAISVYVVSLALQHGNTHFRKTFVRDGVVDALMPLADKPIMTTESQQAKQIITTYFESMDSKTVLDDLNAIVQKLNSTKDPIPTLTELSSLLEKEGGLTSYELNKSDLLRALHTSLVAPERASAFAAQVFPSAPKVWVELINLVQEVAANDMRQLLAGSVVETLHNVTALPTVEMLEQLSQHFKIKLHVVGESSIPPDAVVLVEPLARIDTMQEFISEKLFGKNANDDEDNDDGDDEDKNDEEEAPEKPVGKKALHTTYLGKTMPLNMSILEVLIKHRSDKAPIDVKSLWDKTHELHFHLTVADDEKKDEEGDVNQSSDLQAVPDVAVSFKVLADFHGMALPLPSTAFENHAMTAHIKKWLLQPLVVATDAYPAWLAPLFSSFTFLIPLETKLNVLYATSFGPVRAIQYLAKSLWKQDAASTLDNNASRQIAALNAAVTRVAKIPRLKVRVARSRLLPSAVKLMNTYGGQKAVVEIEYLGEVGTGLGPTTEFYSLVSRDIQAQNLRLWRHDGPDEVTQTTEEDTSAKENQAHALPVRGYHRIAVVHCPSCAHVDFPTCPTHGTLLTKADAANSKPSTTTQPLCHLCTDSPAWSLECPSKGENCSQDKLRWLWWIVSDQEMEYLSKAYPRSRANVVHPVLQCSHCDTVSFPGTDSGIVTMEGGRMMSRSGRRMYERDYRAVTKHVSALCEGTPLQQTNVVLYRSQVDKLVDMVPKAPEVLDSEIDGMGIDASFTRDVALVNAPHGLYPAPLPTENADAVLAYYEFLGKFVAQALIDERLLDLPFSMPLIRLFLGETLHDKLDVALQHVHEIDPSIGRSLQYLYEHRHERETIDSMGLNFVSMTTPSVPLCEGGEDMTVSSDNVEEYLELTTRYLLHTSVSAQVDSFRKGFNSIVPLHLLEMLTASDWTLLLSDPTKNLWPGGAEEIRACMVCDHGYSADSQAIQWLVEILVAMSPEEQKLFVRFVTGSHRLPVGGLAKLEPPLTVVRKLASDDSHPNVNDTMLPSASTCTNYLKLPAYSSKEIMHTKLLYCIQEGQLSFHLS